MLLYVLVNISLLCMVPIFGYFVAFESELRGCVTSYAINERRFLLTVLCLLLAILLVLWIMVLVILCKEK